MPEHLIYNIYKISNNVDDKIYIGSTRLSLAQRHAMHRYYCDKKTFPLYKHMNSLGKDNFKIESIKTVTVGSRNEARQIEQLCIEQQEQSILLNATRAFSENHNKTRDNEKKKQNRRDFYQRHKEDPEWVAKERERNRLRMQKKREMLKTSKDM